MTRSDISYLLENKVPADYVLQLQFSLWVTQAALGRSALTACPSASGHCEVFPDPKIQAAIGEAITFNKRFDAALAQIDAMRGTGK